jgi:hypothetical protein
VQEAKALASFARRTKEKERLEERSERERAERDEATAPPSCCQRCVFRIEAVERDESRERLSGDLGERGFTRSVWADPDG